jgi:hypothetical protein
MKTRKILLFALTMLFLNFSSYAQLKIDNNGNTTVNYGTFSPGIDGILYLGNTDHYIKSKFGYGVSIGTAGEPDAIKIPQYSGRVGLFMDPLYTLDVNGIIRAYNVNINSDIRLKKDIMDLSESLTKLSLLRGVSYNLITYENNLKSTNNNSNSFTKSSDTAIYNRRHLEFIAQEIKTVFPELVYTDNDGMLSVNYIGLIPVIVDALKHQQSTIEDLQNKLASVNLKSSTEITSITDITQQNTYGAILYQNTPNPFSQTTQIKYYLPNEVKNAILNIYDMQGQQIRSIPINNRGNSSETINGSELHAGLYFYSLIADGHEIDTKRMILTN